MSFDGTGTYNLVAGLEANLANGQTNDGTEVYGAFDVHYKGRADDRVC